MNTYITISKFNTRKFYNFQSALANLQCLISLGINAKLVKQDLAGNFVELF